MKDGAGSAAKAAEARTLLAAATLAALLLAGAPLAAESTTPTPEALPPAPVQPSPAERPPSSPIRGLALGTAFSGGAALTLSPYFPLKAQPWYSVNLTLDLPLGSWLGWAFDLDFRGTGPSNINQGYLYRGHHGLGAGTYLTARGRLARAGTRLDLLGGIAAGVSTSFEVYSLTELVFFYPSLLLEPYLEFHFLHLGPHTFSLSLPARLDFRKDLDLSAALGLGLRWRWYPGWKKEKA